jgi:hypothetical protein
MSTSDTQRSIVRTLDLGAELERDILDDQEIGERLDYVAKRLDVLPDVDRVQSPQLPARNEPIAREARQEAIPVSPQPRPAAAGGPAPQRPAAPRSAPQRYAADYATAIGMLTGNGWTVHALADVLGVAERTARDRLNAWIEQGLVAQSDTKGRFYFTERGGA